MSERRAPVSGSIYQSQYQWVRPTPEPWMDEALCAEADPEMFFPSKGGSTMQARSVCARCDVAAACLAYALRRGELFGIWGGKSPRERAQMRSGGRSGESMYS